MGNKLIAASTLLIAGCASADELDREGYYVGVTGAYAFEDFDVSVPGLDFDDSVAGSVRVGYRTHPTFAGEIQAEYYHEWDAEVFDVDVDDVDGFTVGFNGKFYYPLGSVHPYVLGGVGYMRLEIDPQDDKDAAAFWRVGLGADWYLTDSFYLTGEGTYVFPSPDLDDFRFYTLSAGVGYRF